MMLTILFMTPMTLVTPNLLGQTAFATVDQGDGATTATLTAPDNATQQVAVGGGNITFAINQFSPGTVEIQTGENVTFFAPPGSVEVHNVVFDLSDGTIISGIEIPFALPPDIIGGEWPTHVYQELVPASPYNLGEPLILNTTDGSSHAIVGYNKILFYPAVVYQDDSVMYLEEQSLMDQMFQREDPFERGLSTSYSIEGTERLVSSGIVLDVSGFRALETLLQEEFGATEDNQGMTTNSTTTTPPTVQLDEETMAQQQEQELPQPKFPILDSFTVTFNEPGTYDYFCAFHPGMFGQVVVGGN
jgi:plastocyanin